MRILYVSQYFPPEMGAPAARVHELSREWVRRGHDVTVLTGFAHHPTGVLAPQDRGRLTRRERVDGIDVIRSWVWATPNAGTLRRMISYASFMVSATVIGAVRASRPEVVVATSPQLLCACAGYVLARCLHAPFVFEVRDLWPESIMAVGAMDENALVGGLRRVASFLYRNADRIVTVGHGYREEIHARYGIPLDAMDVVPNGVDGSLFVPAPRDNPVRAEFGWGDRFVALYLGTHGMAHALDSVLRAAKRLEARRDILFVLVGEGAEKEDLKRQAEREGITNVQFIGQQPKDRVRLLYAASDVGLVTLRDTPLFQSVLPSKIFENMGMERGMIVTVGGEARRLVEEAGAGLYVPPEDPAALAGAVAACAADREALAARGRSGRRFVLEHYDRAVLAERYLGLLARVAGRAAR
ncbi:MAG: glycosyltransferase family 4 protein [Planctomycetia bacterium]|nr:glycosyltransferase family 4 protein [Planctomycetia bacterium]